MSSEINIVALPRTPRAVMRFLKVSYGIYRDDPNWVAPLLMDQKKVFTDENPLFEHAEMQLWVAVLFMAIAFGAGVLVHAMAAPQPSSPPVVSTVGDGGATGGVFAPPLSDDQVSAGLPAGHPDIAGGSKQTDDGNDGKAGKGAGDETDKEGSSP